MKNQLIALAVMTLIGVSAIPAPAKADRAEFSFTFGGPLRYDRHDRDDWRDDRRAWGHRRWHHEPDYRPVFYAPPPPIYLSRPREVVYVTPAPQYIVVQPNMIAQQTSVTYVNSNGQSCREYQANGVVAGSQGAVYGTACLQPDGSWRVMD